MQIYCKFGLALKLATFGFDVAPPWQSSFQGLEVSIKGANHKRHGETTKPPNGDRGPSATSNLKVAIFSASPDLH